MSKKIKTIDVATLKQMHTGSLISRRKALLACEESIELSDHPSDYQVVAGYIEFKQSEVWQQAYQELKSELAQREHWNKRK